MRDRGQRVHLARWAGVAAALLCWSAAAAAAVPTTRPVTRWRLSWTRGPGAAACIDEGALRRRVRRQLGRDPFAADTSSGPLHTLAGRIRRTAAPEGGWQITVEILDHDRASRGSRQLVQRERACRALDQAIALIVAIAVDTGTLPAPAAAPPAEPAARRRPVKSAPPDPPAAATPLARPAAAAVAPGVSRRSTPPPRRQGPAWHPALRAGGALDVGTLPGAALGATLQLDAGWPRRVPLTLAAAIFPHAEVEAAGGRSSFRLITLSLGVRPTLRLTRRLRLVLAGELELGWLRGQGSGFDRDLSSTQTLVNLGVDAGLRLRLTSLLHAGVWVGVRGLLRREPFYIDAAGVGAQRVHRPSPASFRGGAALGITLP